MTIQYLAKAASAVTVAADLPAVKSRTVQDAVVSVDVRESSGTVVVHADMTMYVSPRKR